MRAKGCLRWPPHCLGLSFSSGLWRVLGPGFGFAMFSTLEFGILSHTSGKLVANNLRPLHLNYGLHWGTIPVILGCFAFQPLPNAGKWLVTGENALIPARSRSICRC